MLCLMSSPRVGTVKLGKLLKKFGSPAGILGAGYESLAGTGLLKADQNVIEGDHPLPGQ